MLSSHLIALISTILFIRILIKRSFWNQAVIVKLPVTVTLYVCLISAPLLFNFGVDIHTPYSLFYYLLNFPVVFFLDVDKIEIDLWRTQSLKTSNLTFGILSIGFWSVVSSIVGIGIFVYNKIVKKYNQPLNSDG